MTLPLRLLLPIVLSFFPFSVTGEVGRIQNPPEPNTLWVTPLPSLLPVSLWQGLLTYQGQG